MVVPIEKNYEQGNLATILKVSEESTRDARLEAEARYKNFVMNFVKAIKLIGDITYMDDVSAKNFKECVKTQMAKDTRNDNIEYKKVEALIRYNLPSDYPYEERFYSDFVNIEDDFHRITSFFTPDALKEAGMPKKSMEREETILEVVYQELPEFIDILKGLSTYISSSEGKFHIKRYNKFYPGVCDDIAKTVDHSDIFATYAQHCLSNHFKMK